MVRSVVRNFGPEFWSEVEWSGPGPNFWSVFSVPVRVGPVRSDFFPNRFFRTGPITDRLFWSEIGTVRDIQSEIRLPELAVFRLFCKSLYICQHRWIFFLMSSLTPFRTTDRTKIKWSDFLRTGPYRTNYGPTVRSTMIWTRLYNSGLTNFSRPWFIGPPVL